MAAKPKKIVPDTGVYIRVPERMKKKIDRMARRDGVPRAVKARELLERALA